MITGESTPYIVRSYRPSKTSLIMVVERNGIISGMHPDKVDEYETLKQYQKSLKVPKLSILRGNSFSVPGSELEATLLDGRQNACSIMESAKIHNIGDGSIRFVSKHGDRKVMSILKFPNDDGMKAETLVQWQDWSKFTSINPVALTLESEAGESSKGKGPKKKKRRVLTDAEKLKKANKKIRQLEEDLKKKKSIDEKEIEEAKKKDLYVNLVDIETVKSAITSNQNAEGDVGVLIIDVLKAFPSLSHLGFNYVKRPDGTGSIEFGI
jgi:hypothetical protein